MEHHGTPDHLKTNPQIQRKESGSFFGGKNNSSFFGNGKTKQAFFGAKPAVTVQQKENNEQQQNDHAEGQEIVQKQGDGKGVHAHGTAIQLKTDATPTIQREERSLPENLGPRQDGSLAVRGEGDNHAFSPNDVNQGSIGDCYFLASLIAVSNTNPNLLQNAITENSNGTYTVRLFRPEQRRTWLIFSRRVLAPVDVTVYPTFPVAAAGRDAANPNADANPGHAHGGDQNSKGQTELWVRLIEKAYALLIGSYAQIGNGGFGANALEALTGQAYQEEVLGGDTKQRIIQMVNDGTPVEVATNAQSWNTMSDEMKRFARANSIVAGHSYAVMSATNDNIRVRNPWGTGARNAEPTLSWDQFNAMFWQFSNRQ